MKQPKTKDLRLDVRGTEAIRNLMKKAKKIKITVNVDEDVISDLKKLSQESGVPYQTLMNRLLRDAVSTKRYEGTRLDRIEKELQSLKKKLSA